MKKQILSAVAASVLFATSAVAIAQQPATNAASPITAISSSATASTAAPEAAVAPTQAGRYTGPSAVTLTTVKQLLDSGKDDQYVRLQGKIISHEHGKNYTFADDSGSMKIEVSPKRFPEGQTIGAEQRVELSGKLDKDWRTTEFEVKEIRLMP